MTDTNLSLWGLWLVPLGLAICFGPALIVWVRAEMKAGKAEKNVVKPRQGEWEG